MLCEWHDRGVRDATVVYLDAHLDLQHVGDERLAQLRDADTEAFRALEKPDHLLPDDGYVFGLENFLYPASRLGIVGHLIWVAPPHVEVGASAQVLEHVQQMDGVTLDELASIRRAPGGWYEATLLGLRLTICTLEQLAAVAPPDHSFVDIDVDYFVALPSDRAWIDPADVYAAVNAAVPKPALVSTARSTGSAFLPHGYRYFADYLAALWRHDQDAVAAYHSRYQRGETETADDDPVRLAAGTVNRRLSASVATLDRWYAEFLAQDPAAPEGQVAFGLAYAQLDQRVKALECYHVYARPHPQLALAIADLLAAEAGERVLRRALLEVAVREDGCATWAHLQLADLARLDGDLTDARAHLEQAHARAPAWPEPVQQLARLHAHSGESGNPWADVLTRQATVRHQLLRGTSPG